MIFTTKDLNYSHFRLPQFILISMNITELTLWLFSKPHTTQLVWCDFVKMQHAMRHLQYVKKYLYGMLIPETFLTYN